MSPVWLFAIVAAATPATQLATAEDLVSQVRYADAEKALVLARAQPENPRETLLRILELQGIVAATLNEPTRARAFFQTLIMIDPTHKVPEGQPPRVKTPFYEAKGMASEAPPMIFTTSSDSGPDGAHFHAQLSADPLGLAKKVRFRQRQSGGAQTTEQVEPLVGGTASVVGGRGKLEWWAELLGDQDAVLLLAGSSEKPFTDGVEEAKPVAGREVGVPLPDRSGPSRFSPAVIGLLSGAAAATAGGVAFGLLSRDALGHYDNAAKDGNGIVTGLTQRQAASLADSGKTDALIANVCFGTAIALAATGVVVFLVSGHGSQVAVAPSPNGVVVAGHF